jgi:acetyl/propionyl-CoA carboxylase alpha subunit
MLKVTVDDEARRTKVLQVDRVGNDWTTEAGIFKGDIAPLGNNRYHVIWDNRAYSVEIVDTDLPAKTFGIRINGRLYTTAVKDELDQVLEQLGLGQQQSKIKINNVKAPMPGLIQSVGVKAGDEVLKGDSLLVLVAMKMENVIKASGDGTVKALMIEPGQSVEKNQVLLEFE